MRKPIYILLLSPLLLAFTCNTMILRLAKESNVSTEIIEFENEVYLKANVSFDEGLMARKRIDSIQFRFFDQNDNQIGVISRRIQRSPLTENPTLHESFSLAAFLDQKILEVRIRPIIFKKAQYLRSEYLSIAEYDLSSYK